MRSRFFRLFVSFYSFIRLGFFVLYQLKMESRLDGGINRRDIIQAHCDVED